MNGETVRLEEQQKLVADALDAVLALEGTVYPNGFPESGSDLAKALSVLRDKLSRIDSAIDDLS